jgi:hypothetical protein
MAYTAKPISEQTASRAPWSFTTNTRGEIKPVYHTVPLDEQGAELFAQYKAAEAKMRELESALTDIATAMANVSTVNYQGESKPMIPQGFSARVGFKFDRVSVWAVEGESVARTPKATKANPAVSWGSQASVPPQATLIRKGKKVA